MTRMELLIQGDFLGLITAEVFVLASYSYTFAGAQFYVRVTVDLSGINSVRKLQYFVGYWGIPPHPPPIDPVTFPLPHTFLDASRCSSLSSQRSFM